MEKMGNAYKILLRKTTENRSLGRYRRSWKNEIKINLKENMKVRIAFIQPGMRTSNSLRLANTAVKYPDS